MPFFCVTSIRSERRILHYWCLSSTAPSFALCVRCIVPSFPARGTLLLSTNSPQPTSTDQNLVDGCAFLVIKGGVDGGVEPCVSLAVQATLFGA
jgi:hypothetical protein